MHESAAFFSNIEWPPEGAQLAGPIAWVRGWIVGKPGHDFIDLRVQHAGATHRGVLGLPRVDLAAHFKSARPWLPAEFILGVPLADGAATLTLEAMDALGGWHPLPPLTINVTPSGAPAPRVEGRVENSADGTWTVRDAHHPFHGHCDQPGATPRLRHGRAPVFGWLLDETRPLSAVLATTDTLVFNHLAHSLTDDSLAARVKHPGARHARLRGEVDVPASLPTPACLRIYAVSPDGSVHLCFAQRITPVAITEAAPSAPPQVAAYSDFPSAILPELPSARPRRLLIVLRSLFPNDATLRALDLAQHLITSHRWAARVVSTEDGPLRAAFERAGAESLIVNPEPLLAAPTEAAMHSALEHLRRQIRWDYLDTVAVFDPLCGWAITLSRRRHIPVLFDCSEPEPCTPDPTAINAVQTLLRDSWQTSSAVCFSSHTAARAQTELLSSRPARIIPQWHTPGLPEAASAEARIVLAPLRTADWLHRYHPETAARWTFRQGPAGLNSTEQLARLDDAAHSPALARAPDWATQGVCLVVGPLFERGPLRPLLDAGASGIPVVAPRRALTEEIFHDSRVPLLDEADPVAAAHAVLSWEALPASFQREAATLAPIFRARHAPDRLLAEWETLLASVAASRR